MKNVLILCTANSARSILGEAILNRVGAGRFRAYSAGSHPRGEPNPLAIETLRSLGYPTHDLRSKSWDEFARPDSPAIDLVITVCRAAARETCPHFTGAPMRAHWAIHDPSGTPGGFEAEKAAFRLAHDRLLAKMTALVALPIEKLSEAELRSQLAEIANLDNGLDD